MGCVLKEVIMDDGVPVCDACEAVVKPDIVMFGERLPENFFTLSSQVCALTAQEASYININGK